MARLLGLGLVLAGVVAAAFAGGIVMVVRVILGVGQVDDGKRCVQLESPKVKVPAFVV